MAADCYIGEVSMFACNYAPRGSMFCAGQEISINQFTTLYAILGTTYGGDGRTTFALPDLRGRAPIHKGQRPGLSHYIQGYSYGNCMAGLSQTNLPPHSHDLIAAGEPGNSIDPNNNFLSQTDSRYDVDIYTDPNKIDTTMNPNFC